MNHIVEDMILHLLMLMADDMIVMGTIRFNFFIFQFSSHVRKTYFRRKILYKTHQHWIIPVIHSLRLVFIVIIPLLFLIKFIFILGLLQLDLVYSPSPR